MAPAIHSHPIKPMMWVVGRKLGMGGGMGGQIVIVIDNLSI